MPSPLVRPHAVLRRFAKRAAVALVATAVSAVGQACTSPVAATPPPHRVFVADDGVVAIVSPNNDAFVCSASVVGARTILSAAHCFHGGNYDKTGWTFQVVVSPTARAPAPDDLRAALVEIHLHPDYADGAPRADGIDADIAVAVADVDLDVPIRPYRRSPPPMTLVGPGARYGGFGAIAVEDRALRHFEPAEITSFTSGTVEMRASHNPCHGDSGGPILATLDGVETILGVGHVAYGDTCDGGANYTRTDVFADFVGGFVP